jgi:hypothetical protein
MVQWWSTRRGTTMTDRGSGRQSGSTTALTIIEPATAIPVPTMIAGIGERAELRFIDFFTAHPPI